MLTNLNKTWKDKKYDGKVLHGIYTGINNDQPLDYVESRKLVYDTKYYVNNVKNKIF